MKQIHQEVIKIISDLMPDSCFLPQDWQTHYNIQAPQIELPNGVRDAKDMRELLISPCPIKNDGKTSIKDTSILTCAPKEKFTILTWRDLHPKQDKHGNPLQPIFWGDYSESWYIDKREKFARQNKNRYSIYLHYKDILPNSTNEWYADQIEMLPEGYEPAFVSELSPALFCHFKKYGVYLYQKIYGRCKDVDSGGVHVSLGDFDSDGLFVVRSCDVWGDGPCLGIGLAVSRKLFSS
jgi:hypothetical protein